MPDRFKDLLKKLTFLKFHNLNETVTLTGNYYHGTPSKIAYENIIKNGLKPQGFLKYIEKYNTDYNMMPITYGLYLTKDLWQAARYSFMSNQETYGYILEFDPKQFGKIYLDEDFLENILRNIIKNPKNNKYPFLAQLINRTKSNKKINLNLPLQGLAKDIINLMTPEQIETIIKNENPNEIVSRYKTLKPTHGYKIIKPQQKFFKTKEEYISYTNKYIQQLF